MTGIDPNRSFIWGDDVRCLIQLYLNDQDELTFNLWLCVSQDREKKRYWKRETPIENRHIEEFDKELAEEIRRGRERLVEWSLHPDSFEFAMDLAE